jgi:hypothetical protein
VVKGFFKQKNMKTIDFIVPMSITANQVKTASFTLPKGFVIGASVYTNGEDTGKLINGSLKDDSGVEICKASTLKHWRSREGGGFVDSLKPLNFETEGKTYQFELNDVYNALTAELKVQVVFVYETK